ncbi:MAG: hypothetical protein Q4C96_11020 [Planctomycetia bacterium]|nr:hypothetical protein [Planctomycetia bacterium]
MLGSFFQWLWNAIKSLFDVFYDFFVNVFDFFWGLICAVGQWIVDLIYWCVAKFQFAFYYALDWILVKVVDFYLFFLELLPPVAIDGMFSSASTVAKYCGCFNAILPLSEMVICGSLYFSILLVWSVYKLVKSWIPTVSGS